MNSLGYTNIQGVKLAMRALLEGTFLPVQRTCKKKAKFSYRFSDPGRTGTLRALSRSYGELYRVYYYLWFCKLGASTRKVMGKCEFFVAVIINMVIILLRSVL